MFMPLDKIFSTAGEPDRPYLCDIFAIGSTVLKGRSERKTKFNFARMEIQAG
jgi:hypothetical protein